MSSILDDDLLDAGLGGGSLDIELSAPARHARPAANDRPWPTGVTPEPGSVAIAESQLEPLCTWGARPQSWWQSVPYAYFVYQGRHQLQKQARAANDELSQAESRRDECLAAMATRLKDTIARDGGMAALLEAVDTAVARRGQTAQQRQAVQVGIESEIAGIEQALAQARAQLDEIEQRRQQARMLDADAQLGLRRELARSQRIGIEQRAIEQASEPDPAADAKLDALRRQAEALAPQVENARAAATACRSALDAVGAEADKVHLHLGELERRRQQLTRSQSAQLRHAASAADQALAESTRALAELGRGVLSAGGRITVDEPVRKELLKHDESVRTLWLRHQVYLKALDHYDREAARRGATIFFVALTVILVALVWRVMG